MKDIVEPVRLPSNDESIAPVTILDAQGHVVRVVAAAEFRSAPPRVGAARRPQGTTVLTVMPEDPNYRTGTAEYERVN